MSLGLSCVLLVLSIICMVFLIIKLHKTENKTAYIVGITCAVIASLLLIGYTAITLIFLSAVP